MSTRKKTSREHGTLAGLLTTGTLGVAGFAFGCGQEMKAVCPNIAEHIVVVPFTSTSDLKLTKEITPTVAAQAVDRAANSCGRIIVGLQNNQTESDLELLPEDLEPKHHKAINRKPVIAKVIRRGNQFVTTELLEPLNATEETNGSPFFNALVKISEEIKTHGESTVTVVLIGDGVAIEDNPNGTRIDLQRPNPPREEDLAPFVKLLTNLKGSCVMLLGAGAESNLPDQVLRNAREALGDTLRKAGAAFVATRSRVMPKDCSGGTA